MIFTRRSIKRGAALLLSVLFMAFSMSSALSVNESSPTPLREEGGSAPYELSPRASDGVIITECEEGSMTVLAHEEGDLLVFDETKEICFFAEYAEGWASCETYSVFFNGDSRRSVEALPNGICRYGFSCAEGEGVELSAWNSAAINASCERLPKLCIDASVPFGEIDKETWVDASFTLNIGSKQFSSGDYEGVGKVKGRGNSSWLDPKKGYSIKLDKKASLLDIPKTKKYAIIPSYWDYSMMRNYITYKAYQQLTGIGYVPKCEFVDVYFNGEYNGIYLLAERVDIESSKVDIAEADAENMSGGYLIEKDVDGKVNFDSDLWFPCPYWANVARDYFVLKTPEPDDPELTAQMLAYLEDYVNRIHDSIINGVGEPYGHYVDTDSWADFIIVQEVAKNIDGPMKTSCYMYKDRDDDHLYMTAPWDFDLAYGRVNWTNAGGHNDYVDCPPANTADGFMIVNSSNPWMDKLYDTEPAFRRTIMERYTEYRHTIIDELFDLINEQAAYLTIVKDAECEIWPKNFSNGVNILRKWLASRVSWLDSQWLIEDDPASDIDLDEALNIENGDLHFDVSGESSPFTGVLLDEVKLGMASGAGEHGFSMTREFSAADFVAFDLRFEGDGAEIKVFIDGEEADILGAPENGGSGEMHTLRVIITQPGEHTIRWAFTCGADGVAYIDNVSVNFGLMMGDADMNGIVDSSDALYTLRFALSIESALPCAPLADVNGDGTVTTQDALMILRLALGIN